MFHRKNENMLTPESDGLFFVALMNKTSFAGPELLIFLQLITASAFQEMSEKCYITSFKYQTEKHTDQHLKYPVLDLFWPLLNDTYGLYK